MKKFCFSNKKNYICSFGKLNRYKITMKNYTTTLLSFECGFSIDVSK